MPFSFVNKIFQPHLNFNALAKEIFLYQYAENKIYRQWCNCFNTDAQLIVEARQIPFLPISFFKTNTIISGSNEYELIFESSGTTQTNKSSHFVKERNIYTQSFTTCFKNFYDEINNWCIIGLLPSYLQQKNSSLINMVDELITQTNNAQSGFYLEDYKKLSGVLKNLEYKHQQTLLIGVTYALLDFATQFPMQLSSTTIMETGGMKGRRKEITRDEVHSVLKDQFNVPQIHSEYGMTELLSQAYSKNAGRFYCPPWMQVFVRDEDDPLSIKKTGKGALNIIDLANVNSCAFIATDDVGEVFEDGSFAVAGRLDGSDIRGCSLMVL